MADFLSVLKKWKITFRVGISIEIMIAIILVFYSASIIWAVEDSLKSLPSAGKRPIAFAGIFIVLFCTFVYLILMVLSCGTCFSSKYTMKLGIFFAHLLMAGTLVFGVSTFLEIKSHVGPYNQKTASAALDQYHADEKMSAKIDNFQIQNSCCGVNNYTDWSKMTQNVSCLLEETPSCALPPSCFKTKVNTTDDRNTSDSYWPSLSHPILRLNEVNRSQCLNESSHNCSAHPFALPFFHDKDDSQDSQATENMDYPLHLHEFFDEDYFKQEKEFFEDGCLPKIDAIYIQKANRMLHASILSFMSLVMVAYTIWLYYLIHFLHHPVGVVLPDVVPVGETAV